MIYTYSASNKLKEKACNGGAEELSNPIENPGQYRDVPADGQPKRHGRVQVPARYVRRHRHPNKQRQRVRNGHRHQPRRVQRRPSRQLTYQPTHLVNKTFSAAFIQTPCVH